MAKHFIDNTDAKIITYLQRDGRMPFTQIAENLGLSEATVRFRVQKLLENDIIQIVAVADPLKLGFAMAGNIKLHVNRQMFHQVLDELSKINEIWYIAIATGGEDIDVEFHVKSMEDLTNLLVEKLSTIEGVLRTETSIILKYHKRQYDWGTALDEDPAQR